MSGASEREDLAPWIRDWRLSGCNCTPLTDGQTCSPCLRDRILASDWLAARDAAIAAKVLADAADAIQALHPGEVKNSVTFLRDRANAAVDLCARELRAATVPTSPSVGGGVADSGLREAVAKIETSNGTPVTVENLRYAATHGALTTSWVFDVLQGLADALTEGGAE